MASSNLTKENEEALSMFVALTGAGNDVAQKFLEACSWNTQVATDRFFNNPDPSQFDLNKQINNNGISSSSSSSANVGSGSSSTNVSDMDAASEALARRLQASDSGMGGGGGTGATGGSAHPVAQALQAGIYNMLGMSQEQMLQHTQMGGLGPRQYVPNSGGGGAYDPQSGVRQADAAYREQMLPSDYGVSGMQARRQQAADRNKDFSNEWQQGTRGSRKTARTDALSKMFAEPSYRFNGDLEEAKVRGQSKNAWILVNIQSADDFTSHCLNRDVWNDKDFSEIVKSCFILYQWTREQSRGQKFINLYHIPKIPCICIIDPNTGRKEHDFVVPDNPTAVPKVKDDIINFLDSHPNPKAKPKKVVPVAPSSKQKVMSHEDELLAAALEASLVDAKEEEMQNKSNNNNNSNNNSNSNSNNNNNNNSNGNANLSANNNDDTDIDMGSWNGDNDNDDTEFQNEMAKQTEKEKENEKKKYELEPEPAPMNRDATPIRIRMPDGKMMQRMFLKTSKIQQLYTYIYLTEGKENFRLFTPMPKTYLDDSKEKTFEEMNLLRATVVCAFDD